MAKGLKSSLCVLLVCCLLANTFAVPAGQRPRKDRKKAAQEEQVSNSIDVPVQDENPEETLQTQASENPEQYPANSLNEEEEDEEDEILNAAQTTGSGSNLFSLLNIASALFPGSSSGAAHTILRNMIRRVLLQYQQPAIFRRQDVAENTIADVDYVTGLTPPFQRQEEEDDSHGNEEDDNESHSESEEDTAAEESVENGSKNENETTNDKASQQDSKGGDDGANNGSDGNDSDYDEPEGDGQGGGILGLLAQLSGEGGLDLGTLLATVSQIVGDLSGDGFDLNAVLASAFGLFVGLLSEGEENPGSVIASYLLTSLDTITGGGATNNGAYFGSFLSKLVNGISAADGNSDEDSSEENGGMKMADSPAFFISLLMSLSGDMSKTSSSGSSSPW